MSNTKHTPGPWTIDDAGQVHAKNAILGIVYCGDTFPNDELPECTANARLISCAPEMIAMLKRILEGMEPHQYVDNTAISYEDLQSLISKAEQQ